MRYLNGRRNPLSLLRCPRCRLSSHGRLALITMPGQVFTVAGLFMPAEQLLVFNMPNFARSFTHLLN
jgi:hypothetical protein